MPGQSKRGGGGRSSKKPNSAQEEKEGSHIIFTNAKDDPKAKKKPKQEQDVQTPGPGGEEGPKKLDTRTLIGGQSWTGKLPMSMLSEHCQKQKWGKPEYTMTKMPEGFVSSVMLSNIHPKTREKTTLPPFKLPASHKHLAGQPTTIEARHFAATYGLFRISSMKNIHMMLPPKYRDLWKGEFQELKKADVKEGKAWMYEADPFAVQEEREAAQAQAAKQREKVSQLKAKQATAPAAPGAKAPTGDKNTMRGWTNVPKVEMGRKVREQVEDTVREHTVWNPYKLRIDEKQRHLIVEDLFKLGFRKAHIEEAIDECKDREEVLEWLLVHVPEDDLPAWSLPEGYNAGVSIASGDLKREACLKRLADAGYSVSACEKALNSNQGDEIRAAEALQAQLVGDSGCQLNMQDMNTSDQRTLESTWEDEMETLKSIYDKQFTQVSNVHCAVEIKVDESRAIYQLHIRRSKHYPATPPIVTVVGSLPAYIRLSAYRQILAYAREALLGQPMIFNIIEWLETELSRIIQNPGRLRDVSAVAAVPTESSITSLSKGNVPRRSRPRTITRKPGDPESMALLQQMKQRLGSPAQQKMLQIRKSLPAWSLKQELVKTVKENQVTIVSGETGSGKSTQSVQFILDDMIEGQLGAAANIICTQPRRISALGLADRVSEERCSMVGDEIGYIIRGESKHKLGRTKITFVTTGVLLRRLQTSGESTNDVAASLADVSHVVVDEVHERSLDTDFLLILLRDVLVKRKDLKVILMSATLDAEVFEDYFKSGCSIGKVEISGRSYPVEDLYLDDVLIMTEFQPHSTPGIRSSIRVDTQSHAPSGTSVNKLADTSNNASWDDPDDWVIVNDQVSTSISNTIQQLGMRVNYDLISTAVVSIHNQLGLAEGGILIFLPGTAEISRAIDALSKLDGIHALPLHASLTPQEQRRVFPPAPKGKRKVIAATNVAETSITIEDIVAVIDTGKVKETSFDPINNMVKLEEVWASRAACKQRRGRAGRVRAGKCYKLYTRNLEAKMAERPDPEIRRVPLEQLCLSVRAMGIENVPAFLASALTPPEVSAVEGAIQVLGRIGALDDGELTALGRHLSMIPADLRCAKLMIYGAMFGCLEASLTIAAVLTAKSPFVGPQHLREELKATRSRFSRNQGDLIADLEAYRQWSEKRLNSSNRDARQWCDNNFLSHQTLMDISSNRTQYLSSLKDAGFLPFSYSNSTASTLNAHNGNHALIRALIAGSFNPQVARIQLPDTKYAASVSGAVPLDPESRSIKYYDQHGRVFVHPSSTLFNAQGFVANSVYMSYFSKIATTKVFIRDLTPFNAYSLLMFGGKIALDTLGRGLIVDNWLRLRGWARIGVLVSRLRGMLDQLLARNMENPAGAVRMAESEVVALVRKLIELDGLDR